MSQNYSEQSALLAGDSWYAREVHRAAVDHRQHLGSSLRRTAELLVSWLGRQERFLLWYPMAQAPGASQQWHLAAITVHRWLDRAGLVAQASVPGHLQNIGQSGKLGADCLWARLRGGAKRVELLRADRVSGLLWPPIGAKGEESTGPWQRLFERARHAGLDWDGSAA